MSARPVLLLIAAAMALAACGKQGKLDRPPPLWGTAQATATPTPEKAPAAPASKP